MNTLGNVIQQKRVDKKLTQLELAKQAAISRNYISDLENDRYVPSLNTLVKISKVLDIDLNYLKQLTEIQDKYSQSYNNLA